MRSFLYSIRDDLSHMRDNLQRLLVLNEEYAKNGSFDWRWIREHADAALRDVDERGKDIRGNLGKITDLTTGDPSLKPETFDIKVIEPCQEVFRLASRIPDPKSQRDERLGMALDAQRGIQSLEIEIQRLDGLISETRDNPTAS